MNDPSRDGDGHWSQQNPSDTLSVIDEDVKTLERMGYAQELLRAMTGFSNFAISMSIICILAGCITSFQEGFSRVGGAAIGLGWPLGCLFTLCVALTMAQVASAFPTAGGLYHWGSILGGRGVGWATGWFNLVGLIAVLAAINVGTYQFCLGAFHVDPGEYPQTIQFACVLAITLSQAMLNHRGIRVTTLLTDFSGYWILIVATILTVAMLIAAGGFDLVRLVTFTNYSGDAGGGIAPPSEHVAWLFMLGLVLPAYTVTGYDASAHTAEETVGAARNVPRGIVRSVIVSGLFGWVMLSAVVLAIPSMDAAASRGNKAFVWVVESVLSPRLALGLFIGIAVAQYLCGLATVTSASRMAYAFARDGGLPFSSQLRCVSPKYLTPSNAIWTVSILAVAFTAYATAYSTIAASSVVFLYISYVIPAAFGLVAYGRTWTKMGPWDLGLWYRPLVVLAVVGCAVLIVVCMWPPNQKTIGIVAGTLVVLTIAWFGFERRRFQGPPEGLLIQLRQADRHAREPQSRVMGRTSDESVPASRATGN